MKTIFLIVLIASSSGWVEYGVPQKSMRKCEISAQDLRKSKVESLPKNYEIKVSCVKR